MVAKAGDVAFLFLGRWQSIVSCYQTVSFGILACDNSRSGKEADNGLFFVCAAGSLVCAGLSNDFFNWEATADYFGNAEDMMCAGVGAIVYSFRLDWSFCHWKNQRLGKIMECLCGNDNVTADFAVEKIGCKYHRCLRKWKGLP